MYLSLSLSLHIYIYTHKAYYTVTDVYIRTHAHTDTKGYDLGIFSVTILPVVREFGLHPWQAADRCSIR